MSLHTEQFDGSEFMGLFLKMFNETKYTLQALNKRMEFMERNVSEMMKEYPAEFQSVMQELQMTPTRYRKIIGILEEFLEDKQIARSWARSMDTSIALLNNYQQEYSFGYVM